MTSTTLEPRSDTHAALRPRPVELLAPAKNLNCGIEAILHGADAVYIGAPRFGARAAAGNSIDDIACLCTFAHLYRAKVYVAFNTLLRDDELSEAERLAWQLYRAGADALIVQDMGLLRLHLPPIPLHASTQTDNRTPEKVRFLAEAGFSQVVLARELTLDEIRAVRTNVADVALEAFVHGALCVSFSGQCYASQACFGRSANRGECAQFCRLPFDLVDADGRVVMRQKHLLSLKDLNQTDSLEALLDAGVTSLKIEGRLKDASYVKNVTAHYRLRLDALFRRRPDYVRASSGQVRLAFTPDPSKSFNRGFTSYYLHGRTGQDVSSIHTPKSLGEEVGVVKEVRHNYLTVAGTKTFANGDGLCYLDGQGRLVGFRVNRVEQGRLYPQQMPPVRPRTVLFRNADQAFERLLSKPSAERRLGVDILLADNPFGFTLSLTDEDHICVSLAFAYPKQAARTPQQEGLRAGLSRLGGTPFEARSVRIDIGAEWFIPSSVVAEWRRRAVERLLLARRLAYRVPLRRAATGSSPYPQPRLTYLGNVLNAQAAAFYRDHGVAHADPAFESRRPEGEAVLMSCRYCIRHALGWCAVRQGRRSPYREPFYLVGAGGRRFRLQFDCRACTMHVVQAAD